MARAADAQTVCNQKPRAVLRALDVQAIKAEESVGFPVQLHPAVRATVDVGAKGIAIADDEKIHYLTVDGGMGLLDGAIFFERTDREQGNRDQSGLTLRYCRTMAVSNNPAWA